ncbi:hypothetical protein ACOWMA_02920 [Helicobacter pylori]
MSLLSNLLFHSLFFIKSNPSQKVGVQKIFFINRKFVLVQYNLGVSIFILLNNIVFGVGV